MSTAHSNLRLRRAARRAARRGFTLLEIIVVVTIIGLLAAVIAPKLLGNVGKAKQNLAKQEAASIRQQIDLWLLDQGMSRVPDDFDLTVLATGAERTLKPEELEDPWGNAYFLVTPGDVNVDYDVVSWGADGQQGGEGEDADIVN